MLAYIVGLLILIVFKDDVMEVISERNDGWVIAILNGITGLVPLNHVKDVDA